MALVVSSLHAEHTQRMSSLLATYMKQTIVIRFCFATTREYMRTSSRDVESLVGGNREEQVRWLSFHGNREGGTGRISDRVMGRESGSKICRKTFRTRGGEKVRLL